MLLQETKDTVSLSEGLLREMAGFEGEYHFKTQDKSMYSACKGKMTRVREERSTKFKKKKRKPIYKCVWVKYRAEYDEKKLNHLLGEA